MSIKIFLLIAILSLSACGFAPVYGSKSSSTTASAEVQPGLDNIEIAIIPNREGQFLRNALIDRFYSHGMPTSPRYSLVIQPITEKVYNFDITIESEATRRQMKLKSTMQLIDLQSGQSVLKRDLLSIASHNVLESEFSTLVTEQSARENALNDMARQVERHLSLFLGREKTPG